VLVLLYLLNPVVHCIIYLLCSSVFISIGLINAADQTIMQESGAVNKHLIQDKIVKYESLLSDVVHSQSIAKDSLEKHYKKYLDGSI